MKGVLVAMILLIPLSAVAADYVIGDGDVLQVLVWGSPELSAEVTVRPDGKITLPAAGEVVASGLTPTELTARLENSLSRLIKGPTVTLAVKQITNNRIYVFGGGVPSEIVNLPCRTTLFKFLCRFGNFENADLEHGYLMRNGVKLDLDLAALVRRGDFSQDVVLQAEDILFVPSNELNRIYILGAVNTPKYINYRPGIKVLDAILEAEGFTDYAKENSVTVLHPTGKKVRVKVKDLARGEDITQNLVLQPGDYVIVEEGLF